MSYSSDKYMVSKHSNLFPKYKYQFLPYTQAVKIYAPASLLHLYRILSNSLLIINVDHHAQSMINIKSRAAKEGYIPHNLFYNFKIPYNLE